MSFFRPVGATSEVDKFLTCSISAANRYKTLESPEGTDYQVAIGMTLKLTGAILEGGVSNFLKLSLGYADEPIDEQEAAPSGAVFVAGNDSIYALRSAIPYDLVYTATDKKLDIYAEIPSEKYPFVYAVPSAENHGTISLTAIEE